MRIYLSLVILLISIELHAQSSDFTGTWFLKGKKSFFGEDYINGVPRQIKIIQEPDSILIEALSIGRNGDIIIKEKNSINGAQLITLRPGRKKRISSIQKADSRRVLNKKIFYLVGDSDKIDYSVDEEYKLTDNKDTLIMTKTQQNQYSMAGTYIRQLATEMGETGIKFEERLSWQQIKEKAKREHKLIFMDCFATWCGPCKKMDIDVYSNSLVGVFLNKNFISIKVQLDTSKNDNYFVKEWHKVSSEVATRYKVYALPTFLFFSSSGKVLHKNIGGKTVDEFLSVAKDAMNSDKQYYTLLENWRLGSIDLRRLPDLVISTKMYGEKELSLSLASDYMHKYLDKVTDSILLTKDNLSFIGQSIDMVKEGDKIFGLYYKKSEVVDSIMQSKGYSFNMLNYVLFKEYLSPILNIAKVTNSTPNWEKGKRMLETKYGSEYASMQIVGAKVRWFKYVKDWDRYSFFLVQQVSSLRDEDPRKRNFLYLNEGAWDIFKYSTDTISLKKALSWTEDALKLAPSHLISAVLDTKASLLYKLGRKDEAISIEGKLDLEAQSEALNEKREPSKYYYDKLEKMRRNEPTWDVK